MHHCSFDGHHVLNIWSKKFAKKCALERNYSWYTLELQFATTIIQAWLSQKINGFKFFAPAQFCKCSRNVQICSIKISTKIWGMSCCGMLIYTQNHFWLQYFLIFCILTEFLHFILFLSSPFFHLYFVENISSFNDP